MAKKTAAMYLSVAVAMTACGGSPAPPTRQPLTIHASVGGGVVQDLSQPVDPAGLHPALLVPAAGVVVKVDVLEGTRRVRFSLQPGTCGPLVIKIVPGGIAMEQYATVLKWGYDCKLPVTADDGSTSVLEIIAEPPP